ncbi:reverse transcriptase domain-containing protein [Tanacetum coccineum]|uniref:Reverse transcriptase domain-containing protein n=1 Tax=Tanacetum coccineum TaxID=301880 RepID=A0ABQ5A262_9ASTR
MKLIPKKCTFEIEEGMFLGYKASTSRLKVCPDKVDAVLSLPSPKCLKDVQKLNGKLASLNRFLAKSVEKSLPFFKTLKKCTKKSNFCWTMEAEKAFKQMKRLIAELPMALRGPEINYTSMEKLVLALVLSRPEVAARLQKWSIELGEYTIHYRPRVSVKGQILADFIVERPKEDSLDTLMEEVEELPEPWILFDATNNEAEYEALIAGLKIAEQIGVKNLQANVDSRLVANQVNGTYVAKETDMIRYLEKVNTLTSSFKAFSIKQVPRSENKKADALSKIASTSFAHLIKQVLVEELKEKSISATEVHKPVPRNPQQKLSPITSPWPFYKWGIDIAGPFPEGPGKVKFLIIAIDYFTKWIEAKPVATLLATRSKNSCGTTLFVDSDS